MSKSQVDLQGKEIGQTGFEKATSTQCVEILFYINSTGIARADTSPF